jgi:hypothetical protein
MRPRQLLILEHGFAADGQHRPGAADPRAHARPWHHRPEHATHRHRVETLKAIVIDRDRNPGGERVAKPRVVARGDQPPEVRVAVPFELRQRRGR